MFFQIDITGFEWVLGAGITFGLAIVLTYITYKTLASFFIWLTIINAFVVWGGLLELWTLILNVLILTIILFMQMRSQGVSDQ